jgi:homoaconitase/3-isopropylmalate dehydratase large subunit
LCGLPEKSVISETAGLRDMFKEVFKNVSTVVSPDHLAPTPSTSSGVNTQKEQKRA